jgi:hypothetical protein
VDQRAHLEPLPGDGGEPLPSPVRALFESRFSRDLGAVRIHRDPRSAAAAAALHARAFTVGRDIFFGPRQYEPHDVAGRRLLAHELTHVLQQDQTGSWSQPSSTVGRDVDPAEREADAAADALVGQTPLQVVQQRGARQPVLQRQPTTEQERVQPHYPTKEERQEIDERLRRRFAEPVPAPAAPAGPGATAAPAEPVPAPVLGRTLTEPERRALAARLRDPVLAAIRALGPGTPSAPIGKDTAFEAVAEARTAVYQRFGDYASRNLALTRDESATAAARRKTNQVLVTFAEASESGRSLARTLAATRCPTCKAELAGLAEESKDAVLDELVASLQRTHEEELRKAAIAHVGGFYRRYEERVNIPLKARTDVYATAVHELIHALEHPAFNAAFADELHIVEGFTDYLTNQIVANKSDYGEVTADVSKVKSAMSGPFLVPSSGRPPRRACDSRTSLAASTSSGGGPPARRSRQR